MRSDFLFFYESLADEKGGSATVHHSRYGCATVPAFEGNSNFEMGTLRRQFRNNTRVNTVTMIRIRNTQTVLRGTGVFRRRHGGLRECPDQKSSSRKAAIWSARAFCCSTNRASVSVVVAAALSFSDS